jgi:hypothetical protein
MFLHMLFRLLSLFRRPRVTDFVHLHAKLDRLQTELDIVLDGIQRGIITLEDFGEE